MKRLTSKDSRGRNTVFINGQEYHGEIADRLAAYEDTGLTPEEQDDFARQACKIRMAAGCNTLDDCEKIVAENRLIVLPCGSDITIEYLGLQYKGDHWNPPLLTTFADDPTTRGGRRIHMFDQQEVEAAIAAQKRGAECGEGNAEEEKAGAVL